MRHIIASLPIIACMVMFLPGGGYSYSMPLFQCQTDEDCNETNTYCYEKRNCVKCTDCKIYNRHPRSNGFCAKDQNQCGPCFSGMEAESNTDGSLSACSSIILPNNNNISEQNNKNNTQNLSSWIISAIIILVVFVLSIISISIFKYSKCNCSTYSRLFISFFRICPNCPMNNCPTQHSDASAPPPYSEKSPTAPPFEDPPREPPPDAPLKQVLYQTLENEPSQRANAFANPHYIRGGTLGNNDPDPIPATATDDENAETENAALLNNQISIISHPDDEVTQPSHWTPSNLDDPTAHLTTFTNALTLNQINQNIIVPSGSNSRSGSEISFSVNEPRSSQTSNSQDQNYFNSNNTSSSSSSPSGVRQQVNINIDVNVINNSNS